MRATVMAADHNHDPAGRIPVPHRSFWSPIALGAVLALAGPAFASAQEMNPALKELAAAANKEGTVTLSWSNSTLAGIQGAARFQAAMNKAFGTNIKVNFLPGADMARIINTLATEYSAGQKASVDIALGAAPQVAPVLKANFFEAV